MMNINEGYYIQLIDESSHRQIFSASTGNLSDEDFKELWRLVGSKLLQILNQNKEENKGKMCSFRIEASKL